MEECGVWVRWFTSLAEKLCLRWARGAGTGVQQQAAGTTLRCSWARRRIGVLRDTRRAGAACTVIHAPGCRPPVPVALLCRRALSLPPLVIHRCHGSCADYNDVLLFGSEVLARQRGLPTKRQSRGWRSCWDAAWPPGPESCCDSPSATSVCGAAWLAHRADAAQGVERKSAQQVAAVAQQACTSHAAGGSVRSPASSAPDSTHHGHHLVQIVGLDD